jgi:hypothetical protein
MGCRDIPTMAELERLHERRVIDMDRATRRRRRARPVPPQTIFTVTVLYVTPVPGTDQVRIKHQRTWGWLSDVATARRVVRTNEGDIFEAGYYNYAVIEELDAGVLPHAKLCGWYLATYSVLESPTTTVRRCKTPPGLDKVCNFSMG